MTIQEIIESIDYCLKCDNDRIPTMQEDLQTIKEALEKQIPKKPDYYGDGYDEDGYLIYYTWICPNCGKHYEVDYDDYDFCPECGQAIDKSLDWSDNNG